MTMLRLGDVVTIARGTTYKSALIGRPGPVLLGLGSIQRNGGFRGDALRTYGGDSPEKIQVQPGQLYASLKDVTQSADLLGAVARLPVDHKPGRLTQDTVRLDPVGAKFPMDYLYWVLQTPQYRQYCRAHLTGTTNLGLPRADFFAFEFPAPDEYSLGLAATLGALDDKIESNRRAVASISDLMDAHSEKHGADLPTVSLGHIATSVKDSINPSKLGDAVVDHFSLPAFDSGARAERVAASTIMSNKLKVPHRAILLSRLNPRFNRTWWSSTDSRVAALASTEFLVLAAEDELNLAAIWLAVRDPLFREELPKRVTGTSGSHQRVRPDDVLSIEVPDFSRARTETKQSMLALLERAEVLRTESGRLTALRDALLSELLSGRLRIPANGVAA